MKKFILFNIILTAFTTVFAQKGWITPDPVNLDDSITIWVDIKKCERQQLAGSTDPLYMWTWAPKEHPVGHPLHNGTWGASNDALRFTSAGNDIWFYRMIPTKFYECTKADLYSKGINLLLKKKDGTGTVSGGEDKTEDITIKIDMPVSGPKKFFPFPGLVLKDTLSVSPEDVLSITYDRNLETNDTLRDKSDFYCVVKARYGTGSTEYIYFVDGDKLTAADKNISALVPQMLMKDIGGGKFRFSFIPDKFFESKNPSKLPLLSIKYRIMRGYIRKTYDIVAESPEYWFNTAK